MMRTSGCNDHSERILRALRGGLSPAESERALALLETCSECRLVERQQQSGPNYGLVDEGVAAGIRLFRVSSAERRSRLQGALYIAATVLLALGVLFLGSPEVAQHGGGLDVSQDQGPALQSRQQDALTFEGFEAPNLRLTIESGNSDLVEAGAMEAAGDDRSGAGLSDSLFRDDLESGNLGGWSPVS